jgi:hypothetical protein
VGGQSILSSFFAAGKRLMIGEDEKYDVVDNGPVTVAEAEVLTPAPDLVSDITGIQEEAQQPTVQEQIARSVLPAGINAAPTPPPAPPARVVPPVVRAPRAAPVRHAPIAPPPVAPPAPPAIASIPSVPVAPPAPVALPVQIDREEEKIAEGIYQAPPQSVPSSSSAPVGVELTESEIATLTKKKLIAHLQVITGADETTVTNYFREFLSKRPVVSAKQRDKTAAAPAPAAPEQTLTIEGLITEETARNMNKTELKGVILRINPLLSAGDVNRALTRNKVKFKSKDDKRKWRDAATLQTLVSSITGMGLGSSGATLGNSSNDLEITDVNQIGQ